MRLEYVKWILVLIYMNYKELIKQQRSFAQKGTAKNIDFRKQQLKIIKIILQKNESLLYNAIREDLRKSEFETYITELAPIYQEVNYAIKNVNRWSKPKKVKKNLANFPAKSFILPEPYGTTLIISAWNYPYQLSFVPLIAAIASGNTCIIKPSELSPNTSSVIAQLINQNFDPSYLHVIEGGVEITEKLLQQRFDKIFFTGSAAVGKIVAKAAAEYLTPVTLELGGKSPCIVFADTDLRITAKRIIWGKFLNAGQTCIAPDYLLVEQIIYERLLEEINKQLEQIIGKIPLKSESYGRIINRKHLERLAKLIDDPQKLFIGGQIIATECYMEPTILRDVTFNDAIMNEEIFGPILPIIPFTDLDFILKEIKKGPKPLACYIFGNNSAKHTRILEEVSFGGGCINDVVMHAGNLRLPFGGVGDSGMGSYHGEAGFKTFSHFKSILKKSFWFESPLKYPPYSKLKLKIIRTLFN